MIQSNNEAIVRRFFSAIERRNYDELLNDLYAADARIWHNTDDTTQPARQNVDAIMTVAAVVKDWKYDLTRRIDFDGGCVQQFATNLTLHNDKLYTLYVCGIFDFQAGKIRSLHEYYDAASLATVMNIANSLPRK